MTARFDCADPVQRTAGLEAAITALRNGELAVLPTDTVYGLAADAFSPVAVAMLFSARGRNRSIPPTVLVGTARAAAALAADLGAFGLWATPRARWRCVCRCIRSHSRC